MSKRFEVGDTVRCKGFGFWDNEDMVVTAAKDDGYIEARHPTAGLGGWVASDAMSLVFSPKGIKPGTQLAKVYDLTKSGSHWTLGDISRLTQASEAAASARLRDLRALGLDVKCHKHKGEKVRTYTVKPKEVATA